MPRTQLAEWSAADIDAECRVAYRAYRAAKTESYTTYFAAQPHLKDPEHAYKARDLASALPEGWERLAGLLPRSGRHRHYLSGNSSQVLALALLGAAAELDPSLGWLWQALGPMPQPAGDKPGVAFERSLAPETLNEEPRQTAIDFFVDDPAMAVAVECKWVEQGMGKCSCAATDDGEPASGHCSRRVLERTKYWTSAGEDFGLPERHVGLPCPLSFTYQAVRNVAAAKALADGRPAVFALLYDQANPYFSGSGDWPGWPAALAATLSDANGVVFRAASWQQLLPTLPPDDSVRRWAKTKHGLPAPVGSG